MSTSTRGVDHLAIVADDMPVAMDFYTRVMGFRLVHVRRVPYEHSCRINCNLARCQAPA